MSQIQDKYLGLSTVEDLLAALRKEEAKGTKAKQDFEDARDCVRWLKVNIKEILDKPTIFDGSIYDKSENTTNFNQSSSVENRSHTQKAIEEVQNTINNEVSNNDYEQASVISNDDDYSYSKVNNYDNDNANIHDDYEHTSVISNDDDYSYSKVNNYDNDNANNYLAYNETNDNYNQQENNQKNYYEYDDNNKQDVKISYDDYTDDNQTNNYETQNNNNNYNDKSSYEANNYDINSNEKKEEKLNSIEDLKENFSSFSERFSEKLKRKINQDNKNDNFQMMNLKR